MNISIPQLITGIISMFVAVLGVRVISPFLNIMFNMTWKSQIALYSTKIICYIVIAFVMYILVYGMIMGRKPAMFGSEKGQGGDYDEQ